MKKLHKNDRALQPVRPNQGLEAEYRRWLRKLIEAMHQDVLETVKACYKENEPEIAQDALPATELSKAIKAMVSKWEKRFNSAAPRLAKYFAQAVTKRSDSCLQKTLKDAGFTVKFKMTKAAQDVMAATIQQQVGLIKSIPTQYLNQVQGEVMRSVQAGRDLATLTKELEKNYHVTRKRAALIARDQNNKATAAITRARRLDLGITKAIWVHSGGGKEPRPTHLKASKDRVQYDIQKGWYDPHEKKYIHPGELINCFPGNSEVQFADGVEVAYRRWYCGYLAEIVTASGKTLCATPNHPILTSKGWLPIQALEEGDYVVELVNDSCTLVVPERDDYQAITIADVFSAVSHFGLMQTEISLRDQFHGDGAEGDIDIVKTTRPLSFGVNTRIFERLYKFFFAVTTYARFCLSFVEEFSISCLHTTSSFIRCFCQTFFPKLSFVAHSQDVDFTPCSDLAPSGKYSWKNRHSRNTMFLSQSGLGHSFFILPTKFTRLVHINRKAFEGHVYNLQTKDGWYVTGGIITHNCRCVSRPVIKGFR